MNECGGHCTAAGLQIAKLCYDTLLSYGVAAKLASEARIVTPALDRIIEANTLLSGLGFESAGLAAAHEIHNGLTALEETHASYHGEKVAFGVLAGLQLTDADPAESAAVFGFCEDVGLPTTFAPIGLGDASRERLMTAAEKACAPGQPIPAALAAAIRSLLEQPARAAQLGQAAREQVAGRYGLDAMARRFERCYVSVVREPRRRIRLTQSTAAPDVTTP